MSYTRAWSQPWARWYLNGLILLVLSACSWAADITYCSPDNDAGSDLTTSNYMSNGLCSDSCRGSYVFAVLLGKSCWCSNYVPATQESTSQCSDACPGYPSDTCGNSAQGLYAYIQLGGTPSGTAGASSASSSSIPSPSSSSLSSSPSPIPSTSPTTQLTQVYTSIISVTGSGSVRTVVVTPTTAPAQTTDSAIGATGMASTNSTSKGGLSGGAVAGIVIGVAIIIGLIIGAIVFFFLRRKHRRDLDAVSEGASYTSPSNASKNKGGIPSRQVSQMSSAGLLTRPQRVNTTGALSQGESAGNATLNSDRNSTHMTVDQRLNPWAIYSNEDSRASNVSLQDNHDYSRQLRVANPDP